MSKIVIGIDPSLGGLAVCIYSPGEFFRVKVFACTAAAKCVHRRIARYDKLATQVGHFIGAAAQPEAIFIEGYSYGSVNKSEQLAEFGGILRRELLGHVECVTEIAPSTLKKFALGTGKACKGKGPVCAALTKRYDVVFDTDDEFDAYAAAKLGACCLRWEEPETVPQHQAVVTIWKSKANCVEGPGAGENHDG